MSDPKVIILILNWNGAVDTLQCLASLERVCYPNFDTIVIDNGSVDNSVAVIQKAFPNIEIIELGENIGFTGGNNLGLQHVSSKNAEFALLLNNDTEVAPHFLDLLVQAARAHPEAGVFGPTIYYHELPKVVWSAGGAIDWNSGRTWMVGLDEIDHGQFGTEPRTMDFVTGCALMVRMDAVEKVGVLDWKFFTYYEEVEWCVRISRAGYGILQVPTSHIWHKISPPLQSESPVVRYYMMRNRLLFLHRSHASWRAWLVTWLEYLRIFLSWTLRPKWRSMRAQRGIILWALRDFYTDRLGRAAWIENL